MNLSFSHIAWPPEQEEAALDHLKGLGLDRIEVAPLRAFGQPAEAREDEVRAKADWYRDRGFRIGSFQALLFGIPDTALFGSEEEISNLKRALIDIGRIAGWAGASPMVFGSPKNRLRGSLERDEAMRRAAEFFREVGDACAEAGSCLVFEANPEAYGADFGIRLEEAAALVRLTDSPGFGLHLDAGGLALSGEDFEPVLREHAALLRHVHASQPNLGPFDTPDPVHTRVAAILRETGYSGDIAVEMRAQPDGLESVTRAVEAVRSIYPTR